MPVACSVDARRLFTECPLDGQDRPPDGLLQNGLCDFIPNPACQSFFLFIVCISILYIQEELVLKFFELYGWNYPIRPEPTVTGRRELKIAGRRVRQRAETHRSSTPFTFPLRAGDRLFRACGLKTGIEDTSFLVF